MESEFSGAGSASRNGAAQGGTPQDIATVLLQMGGVLLREQTVERILQLATELTERTLTSASAVSVTLTKDGAAYTSNASEVVARIVDEAQYEAGEGPCLHALETGETTNATVRSISERWPGFARRATDYGMGAILSVPLHVLGRTPGALNIYSSAESPFSESDTVTASLLAQQAAAVLANAASFADATALNSQLRDALKSRDLIGQAKGILMERQSCDADAAFDILRRASQRTNRKLRDVATELVGAVVQRSGTVVQQSPTETT